MTSSPTRTLTVAQAAERLAHYQMAAIDHMQIFDDGDDMLFGDVDLFGSGVPCIAGELELQVQSYEGAG